MIMLHTISFLFRLLITLKAKTQKSLFSIFWIFILILGFESPGYAQNNNSHSRLSLKTINKCSSALLRDSEVSQDDMYIHIDSKLSAEYKVIELGPYDYLDLSKLHPHWIENNEVVVTLNPLGHSTFYFNGYRIDSSGLVGYNISSFLKKGTVTKDSFIIFIKDIPEKAVQDLKHLISNFHKLREVTCNKVTCKYLRSVDEKTFNKWTLFPNQLFNNLIQLKSKNPETIDIFVKEEFTPSDFQKNLKKELKPTIFLVSFITVTGSGLSYYTGYMIGEIIKYLGGFVSL